MALIIYNLFLRIISFFLSILGKNERCVVFESFPDYSGSPKMICLELEKRGFRSKHRFVWAIDKSQKYVYRDYDCVPFWGKLNFFERLKKNLIAWNAILIVDSNRPVMKQNKKTFRLYTRHGGTLKKCPRYTKSLGKMDFMLSMSPNLADIELNEYSVSCRQQIVELGCPSNDEIFENKDLHFFWEKMLPGRDMSAYKKIIGWYPTFRQRRYNCGDDVPVNFSFGVPIVKNEDDMLILDSFLCEQNILLAIKIHHAQKTNYEIKSLSNVVFVEQELEDMLGVTNANLLQNFDALITDYSSIYHEYILLDRPVAISIDDFEEYSKNVGFCFDFFEYIKGFYLKNLDDLKQFIFEVSKDVDSRKMERHSAVLKLHKYVDNCSTQRVVDFLCEKVKL